jgi:hypothetical protein|tara:strand:- start:919 stop:1080 length:162 start_codon:yes stop_codon:yes gene_type:complete
LALAAEVRQLRQVGVTLEFQAPTVLIQFLVVLHQLAEVAVVHTGQLIKMLQME